MRILIVKLSSLGDVVHAMPVIHDIHAALPGTQIDWVVEPAFAPLVRRVAGVDRVLEFAQRRWRKSWWTRGVRNEWRAFRHQLASRPYDVAIDLQGLTKSALVTRLVQARRFGLANRTDGASHEWPARWLVDHAIHVPPHIHALDRSRLLVARALNIATVGPPQFGLRHGPDSRTEPVVVLVHGTSRDDKLWPEALWLELGRRLMAAGWRLALPQAGAAELARAERIANALGGCCEVWAQMPLDLIAERMDRCRGVIGVDSGLSHIAVALDLPHVQIYNHATAWRTGPQADHGHRHQLSVEARADGAEVGVGELMPTVDAVWSAWTRTGTHVTSHEDGNS